MESIPLQKDKIKPYIGHPIFAVMQDGTYCAGTLLKISNGHLILQPDTVTTNSLHVNNCLSARRNKANISLFGLPFIGAGIGLLGGGLGLGLGAVSFLFGARMARFFI